jgi:hypothetical protein
MARYDGGAAFPSPSTWNPNTGEQYDASELGMTLRDYFAAAALPAVLQTWHNENDRPGIDSLVVDRDSVADSVADDCYCMADAMLKAREEGNGNAGV